MTRSSTWLAVATLAALAPAGGHADVTLRQTTSGKALGLGGEAVSVTYIKGAKMRTETQFGGKTRVVIFDVDAQKMYGFDAGGRSGDAWDMATVADELARTIDAGAIVSRFEPNGQKKQVGAVTTRGYATRIVVPTTLGGPGGPQMTVTNEGTVWIAQDAPGSADYAAFYRAAATKGWIFSDPRAAKGQPGQAKAMADMYRQFADAGGVPYEVDMRISISGEGPMASMMSSLGNSELRTVTQSVDASPLPDDLFAPPPDLKLKPRK